jgi:hypothetical protein
MSVSTYPRWQKRRVAIASNDWTPVVAPHHFDYVALRCDDSPVVYRTDKDDPNTEDEMPAGVQDGVTGAASGPHFRWSEVNRSRFPEGYIVCWVKSTQPTAELIVTWVL